MNTEEQFAAAPKAKGSLWRLNRGGYWLLSVISFAAYYFAGRAGVSALALGLAFPIVWIPLVAARRFHDFGRSGWWALSLLAFGFAVGFVKGFWIAASKPDAETLSQVTSIQTIFIGLVSLIFIIWLGAKGGDARSNRFGAPPKTPF